MTRRAITNPLVDKAMNRWPTHRQLPAIALLIVLTLSLGASVVHADSGTIIVSGNPAVATSIAIDHYPTDGANLTRPLYAIEVTTSTITHQYTIVVNATDSDEMSDIRKIEVQLYTDSYNATSGGVKHHYSFVWNYQTGFANVYPGDYLNVGLSTSPPPTNSSGLFKFVFELDKLAIYTLGGTHHWTVETHIWDNTNNHSYRSAPFDVDLCQSLTIQHSVTWNSLTQGTTWNPATSPSPGDWMYTSNAKAKIQINATTPTNAYGNTFEVGNVTIAQDSGHTSHEQAFTLATADWLTNLPNDADQHETVYWFVNIPAWQPTGTYTFTYYVTIAPDANPYPD
jgi:hypothetical protein